MDSDNLDEVALLADLTKFFPAANTKRWFSSSKSGGPRKGPGSSLIGA